MSWAQIWAHEHEIECDLHEVYGVDYAQALREQSGRWMRVRIEGLLARDCTLTRALRRTHDAPGGE